MSFKNILDPDHGTDNHKSSRHLNWFKANLGQNFIKIPLITLWGAPRPTNQRNNQRSLLGGGYDINDDNDIDKDNNNDNTDTTNTVNLIMVVISIVVMIMIIKYNANLLICLKWVTPKSEGPRDFKLFPRKELWIGATTCLRYFCYSNFVFCNVSVYSILFKLNLVLSFVLLYIFIIIFFNVAFY